MRSTSGRAAPATRWTMTSTSTLTLLAPSSARTHVQPSHILLHPRQTTAHPLTSARPQTSQSLAVASLTRRPIPPLPVPGAHAPPFEPLLSSPQIKHLDSTPAAPISPCSAHPPVHVSFSSPSRPHLIFISVRAARSGCFSSHCQCTRVTNGPGLGGEAAPDCHEHMYKREGWWLGVCAMFYGQHAFSGEKKMQQKRSTHSHCRLE